MLEQAITDLGAVITTHRAWAGPILGAVAFGESLAIVGLFVPATALMLAVGGLIGSGTLDPVPVALWAIGGAILGDAVSYGLGRILGPGVSRGWPLNRHRQSVARTRLFFRRFGFAAIVLGRFLGPVRSTVPLVAGILRMNHVAFQLANGLSAILWVPIMLAPGYVAAKRLADHAGGTGVDGSGLLTAGLLGSILVTWVIVRRTSARSSPRASRTTS
ncbi:MAG: DedA family protein [Microvirga sp.]